MTRQPSQREALFLQRLMDGQLDEAARRAAEAQVASDPVLQARLQQDQQVRGFFAAARRERIAAPAGFAAEVAAAVHRQGLVPGMDLRTEREIERFCRRLLVAAAVVVAGAAIWASGLFGKGPDKRLEAAPDAVMRAMQQLDAGIHDLQGPDREPQRR